MCEGRSVPVERRRADDDAAQRRMRGSTRARPRRPISRASRVAPGGAVDELGHHVVAWSGGVEGGDRGGGAHQPARAVQAGLDQRGCVDRLGFGSVTRAISATRVAGGTGPPRRVAGRRDRRSAAPPPPRRESAPGWPSGARSAGSPTAVGLSTRSGSPAAAAPTDRTIAAWLSRASGPAGRTPPAGDGRGVRSGHGAPRVRRDHRSKSGADAASIPCRGGSSGGPHRSPRGRGAHLTGGDRHAVGRAPAGGRLRGRAPHGHRAARLRARRPGHGLRHRGGQRPPAVAAPVARRARRARRRRGGRGPADAGDDGRAARRPAPGGARVGADEPGRVAPRAGRRGHRARVRPRRLRRRRHPLRRAVVAVRRGRPGAAPAAGRHRPTAVVRQLGLAGPAARPRG